MVGSISSSGKDNNSGQKPVNTAYSDSLAVRAGGRSYHGSGNNHHASMSPNKLNRVIMNQNVGGKALSP